MATSGESQSLSRTGDPTWSPAPAAPAPAAPPPAAPPPAERQNPYVGPRSFKVGERLYGRDYEAAALLDLLIAERIVVLYSPSGAGKTSLVQAMLIPALEDREFRVLPMIRINTEPPPPTVGAPGTGNSDGRTALPLPTNRYLLSAMLSLEEQLMPDEQKTIDELAALSFDAYLQQRPRLINDGRAELLIFDQFEEILTIEPYNQAAKQQFFEQVGTALRNKNRWALFSMREEFIAGLDPYLKPIPTRFANTFRLDLLGLDAARAAIQRPAEEAGVSFTAAAADKLLNDLRSVKVQTAPGVFVDQPGPYVEPVQLQVVCHRLWERLPPTDLEITEADIRAIGSVDEALGEYYDVRVADVAAQTAVAERSIRDWFDRTLITPQDIRSQVMQGPDASTGLPNAAIFPLIDAHLVRAEKRRGINWFELAHDRLIKPVKRSNAHWRERNLQPFQRQAVIWNDAGRPDGMLLCEQPLQDAEAWITKNNPTLTEDVEQPFLVQCRRLHNEKERTRRNNLWIRWLLGASMVLLVLTLIGGVLAVRARNAALVAAQAAEAAEQNAEQAKQTAEDARRTAEEAQRAAEDAQRTAESSRLAAIAVQNLPLDPERSVLLSVAAFDASADYVPSETYNALQQSLQNIQILRVLHQDQSTVVGVASTADGSRSYSLSNDGTLRVYAADGSEQRSWQAHSRDALRLAVSDDGQILLTGARDGSARLWRADGSLLRELPLAGGSATAVALSRDGTRAAVGDDSGTVRLFSLPATSAPTTFRQAGDRIYALGFSRDGTRLAAAGELHIVHIWNTQTDEELYVSRPEIHTDPIRALAFSPTADLIATGSADRSIKLWDARTFQLLQIFNGHTDWVTALAFGPSGQRLASASNDSTAIIWSVQSGRALETVAGHTRTIQSIGFGQDGNRLITGSEDGSARLWQTPFGHTDVAYGVAVSKDGATIVTAGRDGTARVWDAASGDLRGIFDGHRDRVYMVAYNPTADEVLTASRDGTVQIWQPSDRKVRLSLPIGEIVYYAAWSPDGNQIAVGDRAGRLTIWNARGGQLLKTIQAHPSAIYGVAFSPDGQEVATGSLDQTAAVWNIASGARRLSLAHNGVVAALAFSPDGKQLATASYDTQARIWDAQSGQLLHTLSGHTRQLNTLVYSPDGKELATGSDDATARIWDTAAGSEINLLSGHSGGVTAVRYSPDQTRLLTTSGDRRLRVFILDVNELAEVARTRATRQLTLGERCAYLDDTEPGCPNSTEKIAK